ncbi:MAG TPA: carboxypeptidase regulatory-like domain-containing protein [Candidatus Acidoferrales bacterium]|nr:carboxypeptidase regulatory-like domain-containing protein [Candidatus Acidoferrales bacterium]
MRTILVSCKRQVAASFIRWAGAVLFTLALMLSPIGANRVLAQTAATGALTGTVTDPSGGVVPGATVHVVNVATGDSHTFVSQSNGSYLAPFLAPGAYRVEVSKNGFKTVSLTGVSIAVAETSTLNVKLELGEVAQNVTVSTEAQLLQTQNQALGHVTDERMVEGLPLVTRNYTQILNLSPGVSSDVNDAGAIGVGDARISSHGAVVNDNNFQMNGVSVTDLDSGAAIPVPNPDAIQEFKVQTGQYDASFGRDAGANVDVITKGGSNLFHGDAFEFLRNDDFNANDFFLNAAGKPRASLKQNQFGGSVGGPVIKDKLFFFGSYQGTRQRNGLDPDCLGSFATPTQLTGLPDRSRATLGAAFANSPGLLGPAVAADGSNISSQALALLNATLPDGSFLIPAPQNANGTSSVSQACPFTENQFLANADYVQSDRITWSERFFWANNDDERNFRPSAGTGGGNVPGFPFSEANQFRNVSISNNYVFRPNLVNQFVLGYNRGVLNSSQVQATVKVPGQTGAAPLTLGALGITAPPNDNIRPEIGFLGGFNVGGNGNDGFIFTQNAYTFSDSLAYVHGRHSFRFGGGLARQEINFENFSFAGLIDFFNVADFLTGTPLLTADLQGLVDRAWRATNADAYAQDNIQVFPRLTVNLGLRYERQGVIGDSLGRSSNVNLSLVNPNPPAGGTLQGYVVGSNFQGALPPGVTRAANSAAINGDGQNKFAPRVGYSWQLPRTDRLVLRGGYGMYFERSTGQLFLQLIAVPPFSDFRVVVPAAVFGSTFATPFAPVPTFPNFAPLAYSPTTAQTPQGFSPSFQPSIIQEYSQSLQVELAKDFALEIGYNGTRGTKLEVERAFNQAALTSAADPVRPGVTTNTVANVQQRVPFEGFSAPGAFQIETSGASWYNALDVSLTKRLSHGLQFLAAYTWARSLTDASNSSTGTQQGANLIGNQNDAHARYGPDGFIRPQRFVLSYLYDIPGPSDTISLRGRFLAGWAVSGVTTIQSGRRLDLTFADPHNVFGIGAGALNTDPAQLASGCTASKLVTSGSVQSRLSNYFNTACFTAPPIVGDPEPPLTPGACGAASTCAQATTFGNAGPGIVGGPDQVNFDFALIKRTALGSDRARNLEFRAEFFNIFNHTQFADPDTAFNDPTFGVIQATSVAPRIIQLALKLNF